MPLIRAIPLLTVTAFGLASCKSGTAPLDDAARSVQTDSAVYQLRHEGTVYNAWANVSYTNNSGKPVYFARCSPASTSPMYGLRRTGADSTAPSFIGTAWACVGGVPMGSIAPNETISVRVWLGSTDSPLAKPPITQAMRTGRFRIVLLLCTKRFADSDNCQAMPGELMVSNAFEVRLE
jgi:hypothetical protein